MQYPVDHDQVISPNDLAAGNEYLKLHHQDYVQNLNEAFYTGYLMAVCGSKAEFDSLTVDDRIYYICVAAKTAQEFYSG